MEEIDNDPNNAIPDELCPPADYAQIAVGVYRAGAIYRFNFEFLRHLKLKVIVTLSADDLIRDFQTFCRDQSITHIHLGLQSQNMEPGTVSSEYSITKQALELLFDYNNHPILFHSITGAHETSTLVACLRRFQYWNLTSILNEYRTFVENPRHETEQFVELFSIDSITLPETCPPWYLEEREMMERELREDNKAT